MPIVKQIAAPEILKAPLRFIFFVYWKLQHIIDRLLGRKYKHIVVCGYPRGGTSLLYNMLSVSLDGFCFDEFETRVMERLHRYGNYATKTPMDVFDLDKLDGLNVFNKDICVLVVVRDVRDVITSKHPNVPDEYFIGYENSWWPKNQAFTEWEYSAPGVRDIHQAIEQSDTVSGVRVLKVKYEDLVTATDKVQKELEAFLGVEFQRPLKAFHKNKDKMAYQYEGKYRAKDNSLVMEDKPLVASRAGKWRDEQYSKRLVEQFGQHPELFDILIVDDYEDNRSWFDGYKK